MNKEIHVVKAATDKKVTFGDVTLTPQELLNDHLYNPNENGWRFSTGDPELWKFQDRLLVPGGNVLDLGIGMGRISVFFKDFKA